ncbi:hypothetical protein HZB60_06535 [candidate division KSB1 bacterium]|nr:hypothetical protein [candidate division KSB1 bacterium]
MKRRIERAEAGDARRRSRAAGVTLIETILATTLSILLMTSLVSLYVGAVKTVSTEEKRSQAGDGARSVSQRLERDLTMIGLAATEDIDGDSNDIDRDVPDQVWSDSVFSDFEYATTYELVFTADINDDSTTETIRYHTNPDAGIVYQESWSWDRDSTVWLAPLTRKVASNVDLVLFDYYDEQGDRIPDEVGYPMGGFTLSFSERTRITVVQVTMVTRSEDERNGRAIYYSAPDGSSWYDRYERRVTTFMIRGRNLRLSS